MPASSACASDSDSENMSDVYVAMFAVQETCDRRIDKSRIPCPCTSHLSGVILRLADDLAHVNVRVEVVDRQDGGVRVSFDANAIDAVFHLQTCDV